MLITLAVDMSKIDRIKAAAHRRENEIPFVVKTNTKRSTRPGRPSLSYLVVHLHSILRAADSGIVCVCVLCQWNCFKCVNINVTH